MAISTTTTPDSTPFEGGELWSGVRFHAAKIATALPGYGATLGDDDPGAPLFFPESVEKGSARRGEAILTGVFPFAGQTVRRREGFWDPEQVSPQWLAEMHGFQWLRDLAADGTKDAAVRAVSLVMDWIDHHREWSAAVWSAPVLGRRAANWLYCFQPLFGGLDDMAQRRVRKSLNRQIAHLYRVAAREAVGGDRLTALTALVLACLCLEPFRRRLPAATRMLAAELDRQILPDGGQLERNPKVHFEILAQLVDVRAAFSAARLEVPTALQNAVDRMTPMARFFLHRDGKMAMFNGAQEGDGESIVRTLAATGSSAKPPASPRHAGYERMDGGKTTVIVDAGDPPGRDYDREAHAGALSFEMSVGRERLIVNCGAMDDHGSEWHEAQRSTPAHSTLSLSLTNSSALTETGVGARRARVTASRRDDEGAHWLEMSHDGFSAPLGFVHRRRLFLNADGSDLRGEDTLIPADPKQPVSPRRFEIRFHLHPSVQSSLLANQSAAILRLGGGDGWRFRSGGAAIRLEDSIYMGRNGEARRARQLVLTGETREGERVVKWAVQREGG